MTNKHALDYRRISVANSGSLDLYFDQLHAENYFSGLRFKF